MTDTQDIIAYLKRKRKDYAEVLRLNEKHRNKMDAVDIIQSYAEDDCYKEVLQVIDKTIEMLNDCS